MSDPHESNPSPDKPSEELTPEETEKISGGMIGDTGIEFLKRTTPASRSGLDQFSPGDGPEPPTPPHIRVG